MLPRTLLAFLPALGLAGCGEPESPPGPGLSPNARPEIVAMLRDDLEAVRHPADGGGRAWLEPDSEGLDRVSAGGAGRWTVVYEAGKLGIAEGGRLFFQVSPYWGWSDPQVVSPAAPGYTEVTTTADGVRLESRTVDRGLLGIRVGGRPLAAGERVRIVYGAGDAGARADRFAERGSRFWIAVDGDGDGVRGLLAEPPEVTIAAGQPAGLALHLPSVARPGETVRLTVAVLDAGGNAGAPTRSARSALGRRRDGRPRAPRLRLERSAAGRGVVEVTAHARRGLAASRPAMPAGLAGRSNPIQVVAPGRRASCGPTCTATRQLLRRHRHAGGLLPLRPRRRRPRRRRAHRPRPLGPAPARRATPSCGTRSARQTERFHEPGRFVTLLGYEWTNWIHGHRHVLYFGDDGEVLELARPRLRDAAASCGSALRGQPALTFAHHSAGGPIATDWSFPPDPELEPVTEIVSVHGTSEASDSPGPIYGPVPGNFVRDVLDRGYRLGFVGSGDSHDGHPGLAHLASPTGRPGGDPRRGGHPRGGARGAARAPRLRHQRPADPAAPPRWRPADGLGTGRGRARRAGATADRPGGRRPARSKRRPGALGRRDRVGRLRGPAPTASWRCELDGPRRRRVPLRARHPARRRRRLVEPLLLRLSGRRRRRRLGAATCYRLRVQAGGGAPWWVRWRRSSAAPVRGWPRCSSSRCPSRAPRRS